MKIEKFYNKKEKKDQFRTRFQLNRKEFYPVADTKKKLLQMVDEIRARQHRTKFDLPVSVFYPTVKELFDAVQETIEHPKQYTLALRVFRDFLALCPDDIKLNELKSSHFQKYIGWRKSQITKHTSQPPKPQTINKELYVISGSFTEAPQIFDQLEAWTRPAIPFLDEEDSARELNLKMKDFYALLASLRAHSTGRVTSVSAAHRKRLADDLEFRVETGLRRKEVARLEKKQYIQSEGILRNVRRWKTGTTTKILPLTSRAIEIVESRSAENAESKYIFTTDGEPIAADYRTLKNVCADLDIPYGRYTEDGFIPHDLRHQAGTEMVRAGDIKTASEYLGHSNVNQTLVYLHTDVLQMKEAVRRRDEMKHRKIDVEKNLGLIYDEVRAGKITVEEFIEKVSTFTPLAEQVGKMPSRKF